MAMDSIDIGGFRLDVVRDGEFWLDGGAMFGVVPRAVWERLSPPDARNRIRLQTNCLLVRGGGRTLLVDTGIGDKEDAAFYERFRVDRDVDLIASLEALDVMPDDVDHVINTHLHWDHAGGNTTRDLEGNLVPTFPNARYVIQRAEWREGLEPTERTRASYRPDNFLPLEGAQRVSYVEGFEEIVPGVCVFTLPGHNRSMQGVLVEGDEGTAACLSDLVPTRHHLRYPYIMSYDLYPATTLQIKRKILPMAASGRWLVIFAHDPELPMAYLQADEAGVLRAAPPAGGEN